MNGPSWLQNLKSLDMIKGASPDYMHCTLLGVSKHLIALWTEKCHGSVYDIHNQIPLLDKRIAQVQVPSEIRHKPRRITDVKHWKGALIIATLQIIQ